MNFRSDVALDHIFVKDHGEKVVTRRLICSLDEQTDFPVRGVLKAYFRGEIENARAVAGKQTDQYRYVAKSDFYYTSDMDRSRQHLKGSELRRLLHGKNAIPCKVAMTVYMRRPIILNYVYPNKQYRGAA